MVSEDSDLTSVVSIHGARRRIERVDQDNRIARNRFRRAFNRSRRSRGRPRSTRDFEN